MIRETKRTPLTVFAVADCKWDVGVGVRSELMMAQYFVIYPGEFNIAVLGPPHAHLLSYSYFFFTVI
jgi:hypothetical protein